MRFGVVGYGTGGQHFHAPYIQAAKGCELTGIVARAPATIAKVRADFPDVAIFSSLTEMLDSGTVDAVTITTPPATRDALVREAAAKGVHVVADKPFAPSAEAARSLAALARETGITLGVYHNRRWDADFRTLMAVKAAGKLGNLWRFHSRIEQDSPETVEAGPEGGLLRDLGSHMVDQALALLGPVVSVDAQLDIAELEGGATDAGYTITLRHESGVHSHLSASKMNAVVMKEFRLYGANGSYISQGQDIQAKQIFSGERPVDDLAGWGYEAEEDWGVLRLRGQGDEVIPSEQGAYHAYYEAFAKSAAAGGPAPVTPDEAVAVLAVLDAARLSAEEGRSVSLR
ncbi:Gfo/Idh/MocA family oxidoreductase [Thioclava sp. GXIMD2076]|uniref:Gfo/Idh/MocA family oxidoreductase n=1 Tax=Thioclava kandeliae TaxID=3070818 RepID=A0ABV1SJQ3_9RHOB